MEKSGSSGAGASANNDGGARLMLHPICSLFSAAWKMYKQRWRVLVEIVLLPALVMILGYVFAGLGFSSLSSVVFVTIGRLIVFIGWIMLVFSALPLVFSIHHGTEVDASYKATIRWFWPFVWVGILELFAVMGGFVMLLVPGIWLAFSFSFVLYVFITEGRRGVDALRQSKDYVKGYWWAVFGRAVLLSLIFIAASIIVEVPVVMIAGKTAGSIASVLLSVFLVPFSGIYSYAIFKNLRDLKPHLVGAETKKGTEFIKISAIVGIILPIFVALVVALFIGVAISRGKMDMGRSYYFPPPRYNAPGT